MRKALYLIFAVLWFTGGVYIDWTHSRAITKLQQDNRILMTNNINLIRLNEALSQGVGDLADKIVEKAAWDKKVADKIRDLDSAVKGLYGQTNQGVSGAVRGVQ